MPLFKAMAILTLPGLAGGSRRGMGAEDYALATQSFCFELGMPRAGLSCETVVLVLGRRTRGRKPRRADAQRGEILARPADQGLVAHFAAREAPMRVWRRAKTKPRCRLSAVQRRLQTSLDLGQQAGGKPCAFRQARDLDMFVQGVQSLAANAD